MLQQKMKKWKDFDHSCSGMVENVGSEAPRLPTKSLG
jgi:hypothetical protein